jgi:glycosyltransferase involved in cell wall biosynthesis
LVKELNIPEEKITVIYNAVASIFDQSNRSAIGETNRLVDGDYILSVSSHHPRKNFERLVKAFNLIKQDNLKLCIIGNPNRNFTSKKVKGNENIILENISDNELVSYYKFAKLLVFPSLYEGFGLPIIEAMSLDTKVCVSDIPVFREICGSSASYFDPYDVYDIKNKIVESFNDTNFKLSTNDLSNYSWKKRIGALMKRC